MLDKKLIQIDKTNNQYILVTSKKFNYNEDQKSILSLPIKT